jgi:hypothetical protein
MPSPLTAEQFQRATEHARYPDLPSALAALDAAECEEPICAARFGLEWCLMLTRAARCLRQIGMDFETREKEPAP